MSSVVGRKHSDIAGVSEAPTVSRTISAGIRDMSPMVGLRIFACGSERKTDRIAHHSVPVALVVILGLILRIQSARAMP